MVEHRVGRFLPYTVKTTVITQFLPIREKYFLPRGEMAERGETKFGEIAMKIPN